MDHADLNQNKFYSFVFYFLIKKIFFFFNIVVHVQLMTIDIYNLDIQEYFLREYMVIHVYNLDIFFVHYNMIKLMKIKYLFDQSHPIDCN
jgi:hypothetical protein